MPALVNNMSELEPSGDLLAAFRIHYRRFEQAIAEILSNPTDPTILARLGDDLEEFTTLATQVSRNQPVMFRILIMFYQ